MEWKSVVLPVLEWLEAQGPGAALWIIGLQALLVLLVIPGPFFTMAAGFLFGIWAGLAVAVCGSTLGAVAAYGIARNFPRWKGFEEMRSRPWLRSLDSFIRAGGWQVVLSTRLIPLFPFKLSNYFFGWTRFPFRPFLVGTFVGIIPMTAVSVATGSLASDMAALLQPGKFTGHRWLGSLAGLAAALALFAYAAWRARRKLKDAGAPGGLP